MKNEMTEREMRELDEWIAVHVMGWHKFEANSINHGICDNCGKSLGAQHKHYFPEFHSVKTGSIPFYTTDPAAAMDVLDACFKRVGGMIIHIAKTSEYMMWCGDNWELRVKAETKERAICQFAKQLFEKQTTRKTNE